VSTRRQGDTSIRLNPAHSRQVRNRWFGYEAEDRPRPPRVPSRAATMRCKRRSTRC